MGKPPKGWAPAAGNKSAAAVGGMDFGQCYDAACKELNSFIVNADVLFNHREFQAVFMAFVATRYIAAKERRINAGTRLYELQAEALSEVIGPNLFCKPGEAMPSSKRFVADLEKKIAGWATGQAQGAQVG